MLPKLFFNYQQKGLSLIELIVFIAVMSFFFVASISLLNNTATQTHKPLIDSKLIFIAQQALQQTHLSDYQSISLGKIKQVNQKSQINVSIDVQYAGEVFSLSEDKVKYILVTATHKQASPITLSVYRFEN